MSRLNAIRHRVRDWGWQRAAHWQLMQLLKRFFGFHLFYVQVAADRRDLWDRVPPEVPAGYTARMICKEDFEPYYAKVPDLRKAFIEETFAQGDRCAAAFHNGELVAFTFHTRVKAPVTDQLEVRISQGFRYGFKGWVHPDHRRRNLSKLVGYVMETELDYVHEERGIWNIETHNYASLLQGYVNPRQRAIMMGFVGWFTFRGRQIPFSSRRAKWIGFRLTRVGAADERQYIR